MIAQAATVLTIWLGIGLILGPIVGKSLRGARKSPESIAAESCLQDHAVSRPPKCAPMTSGALLPQSSPCRPSGATSAERR